MISLNKYSIELAYNGSETIKALVNDIKDPEFIWKSSNKNVATVENGVITAVGPGKTYIEVAASDGIKLESAKIAVSVAGILIEDKDTTFKAGIDKLVINSNYWTPSDIIPELSIDNEDFKVRKLIPGQFEITSDKAGEAKVKLQLKKDGEVLAESKEITLTAVVINSITAPEGEVEFQYDEPTEIGFEIDPSDAEVTYSSSNNNIKIEDGKVTSDIPGVKAIVKASVLGVSAEATVKATGLKVIEDEGFAVGRTTNLKIWTSGSTITIESGDESVALVKGIEILGVSEGKTEITIKSDEFEQVIEAEVKKYFEPITELTEDIIKNITIVDSIAAVRSFAGSREVVVSELIPNITRLFYVKNNSKKNVFEYDLVIINSELDKYQSINGGSGSSSEGVVTINDVKGEVATQIAALVDGAPENLDTLKELANELQNLPKLPSKLSELENDTNFITVNDIPEVDLSEYAKKSELPVVPLVPTKVSELENDSDFITANDIPEVDLSEYAKKEDIPSIPEMPTVPTKVSELENDSNFITINDVPEVNLTDYAKKSDIPTVPAIPTKVSELENDSEFITANDIPEVDLSDYAKKIELPTVPTKVSELENDSNFITSSDIPEVDLTDYAKKSDIKSNISELTNDAGFITLDQVPEVDLSDYAKKSELPSTEGLATESYVDTKITDLIGAAPAELDTLKEIADELDNNKKASNAIITTLASKADASSVYTKDEVNALNLEQLQSILAKIWSKNTLDSGYFQTKFTNNNGNSAMLWNESDGGGALFDNKVNNIKSFVGVNDGGDENGIHVQIYSKNPTTNLGSRLNVNPTGIYYKVSNSGSFTAEDELATKKDIPTVPTKVSDLENDSNFLTEHQDISGKVDVTTYNETIGQYETLLSKYSSEILTLKKQVGKLGGTVTYEVTTTSEVNSLIKEWGTVKVMNDVDGCYLYLASVSNTVNLNLNGKSVQAQRNGFPGMYMRSGSPNITISGSGSLHNDLTDADTTAYKNPLIRIDAGNLTISGTATLSVASAGDPVIILNNASSTVTISKGTFTTNHNECIMVNAGTLNISGGTFKSSLGATQWLINCLDSGWSSGKAHVNITGGTFYGFDPSNNPEGEGTTYVAEGYTVTSEEGELDGNPITIYKVVKA